MTQNHTKAIRGLSIATFVLSLIVLVFLVIALIAVIVAWPTVNTMLAREGYVGNVVDSDFNVYSFTYSDLVTWSMGAVVTMLIFPIALSVVTLIAGILGMRNVGNTDRYQMVFVWSIIAAVAAFLCGRIASTVLFIILAVFVSQDRKQQAMPPSYYNQSVPNAYGQPSGYQYPPVTGYQDYGYQNPQAGYGANGYQAQTNPAYNNYGYQTPPATGYGTAGYQNQPTNATYPTAQDGAMPVYGSYGTQPTPTEATPGYGNYGAQPMPMETTPGYDNYDSQPAQTKAVPIQETAPGQPTPEALQETTDFAAPTERFSETVVEEQTEAEGQAEDQRL